MGKYLQLHRVDHGSQEKRTRDLVLDSTSKCKIPSKGRLKGDLWVPSRRVGERICGMLVEIYKGLPEPGTMYKMYIRNNGTRKYIVHKYLCTHGLGWTVTSPNIFLGSVTIYNIYRLISETGCSTKAILCHGPPRASSPPGAHIMGESSLCPWPTGT